MVNKDNTNENEESKRLPVVEDKLENIQIELRYKTGYNGACEIFEHLEIPANTDISDLLKIIKASYLEKNAGSFSGDVITVSGPLTSGKLESRTYTVNGRYDWRLFAQEDRK